MLFASRVLILLLVLPTVCLSVDEGHVLDTREKMCRDAEEALVGAYEEIESSSAEAVCSDVNDYKFPDMCVPPEREGYEGSYRKVNEGDEEPHTVKYDDTRQSGPNGVKKTKMNEKYGIHTGSYIGYKIQPKTEQNDATRTEICASRGVGDQFKEHDQGESKWGDLAATTSWQYFGGQKTGLFAQYPASTKTMCWCDGYDPRYRPWYASAVTGPKDMILVLDVSGSMQNEDRMNIMKKGALAQLDTMTFLDYVQVVSYSSEAKAISTKLLQGTTENKNKLREFIEQLESGGSTNGKAGLQLAFEIFKNSYMTKSSNCIKIISFLTDGEMDDPSFIKGGWLSGQQTTMASTYGGKAHIFTYALGSGATTTDMENLACLNQGWMAQVNDGDVAGIKHAMVRYFEYFASRLPQNTNTSKPRWSDFYMDSSGQGKMTTVSLPIFTSNGTRRVFRGVVGIDVLASDFGENLDDNKLAISLKTRSQQCMTFDFNQQANEMINLVPTTINSQQYKCKIAKEKPEAPFIPTGATIDEVEDHHCDGNLPWWAVLLIVLFVLGCCVCGFCMFARGCKRAVGGGVQQRGGQAKQVQMMTAAQVHHHQPHNTQQYHQPQQPGYHQPQPGYPQPGVPQMYPGVQVPMGMQGQRGSVTMMGGQPGMPMMTPGVQQPVMMGQPGMPMMNQPGGMTPGVQVVQAMPMPMQPGQMVQGSGPKGSE